MDQGGPNHLRAWRLHCKLTLEQLAARVEPPTTKQVIQALETDAMGLSAKWLRRLAPALNTTPGFLLDHDPSDIDGSLLQAAAEVASGDKSHALQILQTFKRKKGQ